MLDLERVRELILKVETLRRQNRLRYTVEVLDKKELTSQEELDLLTLIPLALSGLLPPKLPDLKDRKKETP